MALESSIVRASPIKALRAHGDIVCFRNHGANYENKVRPDG
jgi:hypothetical protein